MSVAIVTTVAKRWSLHTGTIVTYFRWKIKRDPRFFFTTVVNTTEIYTTKEKTALQCLCQCWNLYTVPATDLIPMFYARMVGTSPAVMFPPCSGLKNVLEIMQSCSTCTYKSSMLQDYTLASDLQCYQRYVYIAWQSHLPFVRKLKAYFKMSNTCDSWDWLLKNAQVYKVFTKSRITNHFAEFSDDNSTVIGYNSDQEK